LCNEDGTINSSPCKCISLGYSCNDGVVPAACLDGASPTGDSASGWCQTASPTDSGVISFEIQDPTDDTYILKYTTDPNADCLADGVPFYTCTVTSSLNNGIVEYECLPQSQNPVPASYPPGITLTFPDLPVAGLLTEEATSAYFCIESSTCKYTSLQVNANEGF